MKDLNFIFISINATAVHICDAEVFCVDGSAAAYQAGQAKEYKTIEMEEAMRLLEQERAVG